MDSPYFFSKILDESHPFDESTDGHDGSFSTAQETEFYIREFLIIDDWFDGRRRGGNRWL